VVRKRSLSRTMEEGRESREDREGESLGERTGKGRVWARGTFQGASRAMKMIDLRKAKAK
jgi:hypothetical protein